MPISVEEVRSIAIKKDITTSIIGIGSSEHEAGVRMATTLANDPIFRFLHWLRLSVPLKPYESTRNLRVWYLISRLMSKWSGVYRADASDNKLADAVLDERNKKFQI